MISSKIQSVQNVRLPPLPTIKEILKLYKLRALKQLSQNFLLDLRITDRIIRAAGNIKEGEVMEVGPGPGGLTRSIFAKNPSKVILVEKDPRFFPALEMLAQAGPCPTSVYKGDVLTFNMENMFSDDKRKAWGDRPPNIHLIGNLPFQVATRLIILWLQDISERRNAWKYGRVPMTLTFQHEVAERIVAPPGAKMRCRLSAMCQNWCEASYAFTIPGKAFLPKPDVDVGVVHLVPLETPCIDLPFKLIEKVCRCLFANRQKYCVKGVENLFPKGSHKQLIPEMFERAEVNPREKSFRLSLSEIGRLCNVYQDIINREPILAKYNNREPNALLYDNDNSLDDDDDDDQIEDEMVYKNEK